MTKKQLISSNTTITVADGFLPFTDRPVVCIQGLGFVGAAMAVAVAQARTADGQPRYQVIGIDLPTSAGLARIDAINRGDFPFPCEDTKLLTALREARQRGNLMATADIGYYTKAAVVIVDINLDVNFDHGRVTVALEGFREAVRTLAANIPAGCLVIIETTVPPGTCEYIVAPILREGAQARGLPEDAFLLAHSYERVMPGRAYFDSIVNFWRVYAGHTTAAAEACEKFLSHVINVQQFPLTRLGSTTASEIGKVLENSFRAVNIAFIEEWGRLAERLNIDLFEVIRAIRVRPTHANIMQPGFGVGGYCLTKDPLLAAISARDILQQHDLDFPFSKMAIEVNRVMPLVTLNKVEKLLAGSLQGKNLLILGVSYRQDVGDTRHSPTQIFWEEAQRRGAVLTCHDPYLTYWPELNLPLPRDLPPPNDFHAVIFAVPHDFYRTLDIQAWLAGRRPYIIDANNVLTVNQIAALIEENIPLWRIGQGKVV
jgi:UDP-N-acetyl-D-glucosamine dehydrogenase